MQKLIKDLQKEFKDLYKGKSVFTHNDNKIIACYDFKIQTSIMERFHDAIDEYKFVIIGDKVGDKGLPYIDSENKDTKLIIRLYMVDDDKDWYLEQDTKEITYINLLHNSISEIDDMDYSNFILEHDELIIDSSNNIKIQYLCEKWIKEQVKTMTRDYCSNSLHIGGNQPLIFTPEILDIKDVQYFGTGEYSTLNFKYYEDTLGIWFHCTIIGDEDAEKTKSKIKFPVGKNGIRIIKYPIFKEKGLYPLHKIKNNEVNHCYKVEERHHNIIFNIDRASSIVRHKYNGPGYTIDPYYEEMTSDRYAYIYTHTIKDCVKKILTYDEDYNLIIVFK